MMCAWCIVCGEPIFGDPINLGYGVLVHDECLAEYVDVMQFEPDEHETS
jgi:hypothetical protein